MAAGVKVEGLREVVNTLQRLGVEAADLKEAFNRIGNIVVAEAKSITPVLTGRLVNSIRASKTKNKSVVRAGGARIPYAGVIHYGHYNNITGTYYLTRAVDKKENTIVNEIEHELNRLINALDLN